MLLHPLVEQTILRYISYGWKDSMIQNLIYRRYGVKLSVRCVRNLRENKPCSKRCEENCVLKTQPLTF